MQTSPEIKDLAMALAKAQAEMLPATKDSINPHFRSKYADLNSVVSVARSALTKNNISFIQATKENLAEGKDSTVTLHTRIIHASGQWIESTYPVRPVKNDPQGWGSALSYAKRYALSALLSIVSEDEDDDAEAAMGRQHHNAPVPAQKMPKVEKQTFPPDMSQWPTGKPSISASEQIKNFAPKSPSTNDAGEYVCGFGAKYKNKKIKDIAIADLKSYISYIKDSSSRDGKEIRGQVLEFITNAEIFIGTQKTDAEISQEFMLSEDVPF